MARSHARDSDVDPPERFEPTRAPSSSRLDVDLGSGEIRSIVWVVSVRPVVHRLDQMGSAIHIAEYDCW